MAGDILVDPAGLVLIILAISSGFIGSFTLVWRVSKNYNEQKLELKAQEDKIFELKTKIIEITKDLSNTIDKLRTERREEIAKAVLNQHERFEVIQKQIDSIKVDVKDVGSRVTVVNTKVENHEQGLMRADSRMDKNFGFFTDLYQALDKKIFDALLKRNK